MATLLCLGVSSAQANDNPISNRQALLDGPGTAKQKLRDSGVDLDLRYTNFQQNLSGATDGNGSQNGGRGDLVMNFDGEKLGLWKGFSVNLRHTMVHGQANFNRGFGQNGVLLPYNTAMVFPRENETSLNVTQKFNDTVSISAGKFDMFALSEAAPLQGGSGMDTFTNLGIAAAINGLVSPYTTGVMLNVNTSKALMSFMVYDPRNTQGDNGRPISHTFEDGTSAMANITLPISIAGRMGYHTFNATASDQKHPNLRTGEPVNRRWFGGYSFQQFLQHDADDPSKGWGLFGRIGVTDRNPNFIARHFMLGIGGNNLMQGRKDDMWGVAYAAYDLSHEIVDPTWPTAIRNEQMAEAYYNFAVFPWLRVSPNVQLVRPLDRSRNDEVVLGIRTQLRF